MDKMVIKKYDELTLSDIQSLNFEKSELNDKSQKITFFDNFIDNSINGTIFHKKKFLEYHNINKSTDKFEDNTLLFYKNNKLISVFTAANIYKEVTESVSNITHKIKILKSHPGSSYGGFIFSEHPNLELTFEIIDSIIEYSKTNNYSYIEFRNAEKIFNKSNIDVVDFCLTHRGFDRESEELSNCIYLPQFQGLEFVDFLNKFHTSSKNKVKRNYRLAQKNNLVSYFTDDVNEITEFYHLLCKTLTKYNTKPVHTLEELIYLITNLQEAKIYVVKYNDKIIAGQFLLEVNSNGYHMFYNAMDYDYQNLKPSNYGMINLIYELSKTNKNYYNLGISTENGGKVINYGLFDFKESFLSDSVLRTYWKKSL